MGPQSVGLLAESLATVIPDFDDGRFKRNALSGLEELGLMQRAASIAQVLLQHLSNDRDEALSQLIRSMGPELTNTQGNGLAPFFYLPHSFAIADCASTCFHSGMQACYELTRRFTAEFCVRSFLVEHPEDSLAVLQSWVKDPDPHVRRLISEGTRPRLPWGMRLRFLQEDPQPALALLELLKDDAELYVRRSVANHLGDILKDHPETAYATCERWISEASGSGLTAEQNRARCWIVRHAVRLPAKKGDQRALRMRAAAGASR